MLCYQLFGEYVDTHDVDQDGDMDVLSASFFDSSVFWFENDGNQNFTPHLIANNATHAYSVYAIDLDGDNDIDVLSHQIKITNCGMRIMDFKNLRHNFNKCNDTWVEAIDVDGDHDIDVLSASSDDNKIAWYENDGNENFTEHIISNNAMYAHSYIQLTWRIMILMLSCFNGDNKISLLRKRW